MIYNWSTQETQKATELSKATFSAGLDKVLGKDLQEVQTENLREILNEHWREKQRHHH